MGNGSVEQTSTPGGLPRWVWGLLVVIVILIVIVIVLVVALGGGDDDTTADDSIEAADETPPVDEPEPKALPEPEPEPVDETPPEPADEPAEEAADEEETDEEPPVEEPVDDPFADPELGLAGIPLFDVQDPAGDSFVCADGTPAAGASGSDVTRLLVSQDGDMLHAAVLMDQSPLETAGGFSSSALFQFIPIVGDAVATVRELHDEVLRVGRFDSQGNIVPDGVETSITERAVLFSVPIDPNVPIAKVGAQGVSTTEEGQERECDFTRSVTSIGEVLDPSGRPVVGVVDQDRGLWYLVDPVLADLTGDAEVPGPGHPDATGTAQLTFNQSDNRICFDFDFPTSLGTEVTDAHIHRGGPQVDGPVVVDLDWPTNGPAGCVDVDPNLTTAIIPIPGFFYVNAHTAEFPAGAVRGQLAGGPLPPFFYGEPGDDPFLGDWDGDGVDTPGLYRPSDGKVYLRNSNTPGIADIEFFFGDPGDVPIVGDWDGDGDDTVSVYRPSEGRFFVHNQLGSGDRGLGAAELDFLFGEPGDALFAGDFDGDGDDSLGAYRDGTFFWRNDLSEGPFDNEGLMFGDPFDDPLWGDWDGDGLETPGVYRPSRRTIFLRNLREPGIADMEIFADGFESGDTSAWSR